MKLNTKVVVKDEKLTLTAEATHVKEIVVTANKAFEDATKVKVTVKKRTADRGCTATVEGSKITLAMDAKLTQGDYTITVEGAADEAIEVPLTVEKDETLTTFWIADYIVADGMDETTSGAIKYAALNQYGDKMVANAPTVSCSFGNVGAIKAATATAEGKIPVTNINPVLAIAGVKGTVVLVGDMGVTATKEISYNTFAKAVSVEIAGTYHINSATIKNIAEGDKPSEYELLFTAKDQYGYAMAAEELDGVEVSVIAGLSGVSTATTMTKANFSTRTVNGVDYVAVALTGTKAYAGDATLTIVNKYYGLLNSSSITVGKKVDIAKVTITADNGVYEDQDNVMGYEIVDTEGKNVTDYATLNDKDVVDISGTGLRWEKNKDGSAKLIYTLADLGLAKPGDNTDKAYTTKSVTVKANPQTGGHYLVQTFSFTVYEKRVVKSVTGIASDVTTSISKSSTGELVIESKKFVFADQYSNKVVDGDKQCTTAVKGIAKDKVTSALGTAVYVATNGAFHVNINSSTGKIIATPSAIAGTATVYLKYNDDATKSVVATATNYDAKFTISAYDTAGVDVSTIKIKSVNDGFTVTSKDAISGTAMKKMLTVVATVGGSETVIPADQYVIVSNENNKFGSEDDSKDVKTKTAKITVQVTTWDSSNTNIETQVSKEYEVSRDTAKLYKVTGVVDTVSTAATISSTTKYDADTFVTGFKFKNQYGEGDCTVTGSALAGAKQDSVKYTIQLVSTTNKDGYKVSSDGLNSANVEISGKGEYTFKIIATTPDGSSKDFTWNVKKTS